jgi:hypothetical protein
MYHSLLIHSSAEGHLGCFQVLAVMCKAAVTFVWRLLCGPKCPAPLNKYQGALLLDYVVEGIWFYKKPSNCLPKWHIAFYTFTGKFLLLHILTSIWYASVLGFDHFKWIVVSHCFNSNSLMSCDGEHLYVCLYALCISFLNNYSNHLPISKIGLFS